MFLSQYKNTFYIDYILISRRYQLHLASAKTQCPKSISDAHIPKIKRRKKEIKIPLQRSNPCRCSTTSIKTNTQTPKSPKATLQEENSAHEPWFPDHRSYVFTLEKVSPLRAMPSTKSLPDTTN
jgi:hypothetical protein